MPSTFRAGLVLLLSCLLPAVPAVAQAPADFAPHYHPRLEVPPRRGEIEVDGRLDDAGWRDAARARGWVENWPGDQTPPPVQTEAWIAYDTENLYVAFVVQDDPARVRATLTDRDRIWTDDYVGLIVDTYGSSAWAYEIFVNPLGVQGDLRWTTEGEDMGFDLVYSSEARITEEGWVAELAIPFQSLRFPEAATQEWRANFWRNHPRESRRRYSWAATDRDEPCWLCQFGTLSGMAGVSSGGALEVLPSLTGVDEQELRGDRLESTSSEMDLGVGVRYGISSSLSAAGTYNPDFSQVESDAAQIGVNTTFALFFPEKRPFFQEGSDLYSTWIDQVYTRQINDPQWAVKSTGRMGRSSVAVLAAQDERTPYLMPFQERSELFALRRSWTALGRGRHTWGDDNAVGVLGTTRLYEGGGSGSTLGADGRLRLDRNHHVEAQLIGSWTAEPQDAGPTASVGEETFDGGRRTAVFDGESFGGYAHYLSVERDARHWDWDVDWWATSPTFRADNGFVAQNDRHYGALWTGYTFYAEDSRWVDEWRPSVNAARVWNWEGLRKDEWVRPQLGANLVGQTWASVAWLTSNERFRGEDFRGIKRWEFNLDSNFSEPVQAGAWLSLGRSIARNLDQPVLGRGFTLQSWVDLKLFGRLTVGNAWDYQELRHPTTDRVLFADYILRSRFDYQLDRRLFARLVIQYDGFGDRLSLEPLLSFKLNPFTAFYLGSSHRLQDVAAPSSGGEDPSDRFREDRRQIFFKLQYPFRG